jgi:hypothetical protein
VPFCAFGRQTSSSDGFRTLNSGASREGGQKAKRPGPETSRGAVAARGDLPVVAGGALVVAPGRRVVVVVEALVVVAERAAR